VVGADASIYCWGGKFDLVLVSTRSGEFTAHTLVSPTPGDEGEWVSISITCLCMGEVVNVIIGAAPVSASLDVGTCCVDESVS
jgi:hypothetical protein